MRRLRNRRVDRNGGNERQRRDHRQRRHDRHRGRERQHRRHRQCRHDRRCGHDRFRGHRRLRRDDRRRRRQQRRSGHGRIGGRGHGGARRLERCGGPRRSRRRGGGSTGGASGRGGTTGSAGHGHAGTTGTGGTGVSTLPFSFYIGADVTDQEPQPAATRGNLLTIMKSHGFNYIRLRTFVDPRAADGYDKSNGYDDIDPTVAFGKQVKDAGMGLLVDFHYADNWADPGKQCVPPAWQGHTTIAALATAASRLHARLDQQADRGRRAPRHGADRKREHARHPDPPLRQRRDPAGRDGINPVNGALYYYSERDPNRPRARRR